MSSTTIEQRLLGITKIINNNQQVHHIPSSAVSKMIPTPGLPNYANKSSAVSQGNNNMIANANGSIGINQIGSFNSPTGTVLNGYQQPPANIVHNSGGSNMLPSMGMMRQSNQMIPTPGLNNQQSVSINSESSSLNGFSRMYSSMLSQQKTKQYVGNQNNNMLHGLGMGVGMRSNIQQKPSPYGFSSGVMNGATGSLIENNMQHVNGPTAPEGYLCPFPCEISPTSLQQNLDKQQHQTFISSDCSLKPTYNIHNKQFL